MSVTPDWRGGRRKEDGRKLFIDGMSPKVRLEATDHNNKRQSFERAFK